jgi:hypothetical protein
MCWNKEVSFTTFIVGTIINVILWQGATNIHFKGVLIVFEFALLMQLIEGFLWQEKDVTSKRNNRLSIAAFFANILQPVVGLLVFGYVLRPQNNTISPIIIAVITCLALFYLGYMLVNTNLKTLHVDVDENCHQNLHWWEKIHHSGLLYTILVFAGILLLVKPVPLAVTVAILVTVAQLLTHVFYSQSAAPSLWCFFVSGIPLVVYLLSRTTPLLQPMY